MPTARTLIRHTGPALHSIAARTLATGGAHWPLDDAAGLPAVREIVAGLNGTVVGTSITLGATGPTIQGDTGKAASWSGATNSYVNCGTDSRFNVGMGDFSWGVWFGGSANPQNYRWLLCHNGYSYQPGLWIITHINVTPQLRVFCGAWGTDVLADNIFDFSDGGWHFVVVTRTSGQIAAYLDGVPFGTGATGNTADLGASRGVLLGTGPATDVTSRNACSIALATFIPSALSAAQVAALYGEQQQQTILWEQ